MLRFIEEYNTSYGLDKTRKDALGCIATLLNQG